ncbi:MAG: helix-turn-helix domain-containing protein [Clostridium sp.]|nr:helix-turn-helix domain-containing protein [Clostridium sp.]MCM1444703.1 helix-turn-helix domain-containing protein [Candidatus Amulumruptor caecigallinarius]
MNLGQRLLELRKKKQLSQEEVAEKLNVSRQTISKWETDQSTPDFDRITPLCDLYDITPNELLTGEKNDDARRSNENESVKHKRAIGIGVGILLYFVAIAWIMITIPVLMFNPVVASAIFLIICGVATSVIIYTCIVYKKEKTKENKNALRKQIESILSIITVIIYLLISFITMAWHITWIIWIVYALICEILKLIFIMKGEEK